MHLFVLETIPLRTFRAPSCSKSCAPFVLFVLQIVLQNEEDEEVGEDGEQEVDDAGRAW